MSTMDFIRALPKVELHRHLVGAASPAGLVRGADDIRTVVVGLARDLATQHVRYAEVMVAPYLHRTFGMADAELLDGLAEGRKQAAAEHGVAFAWIFDIPGEYGPPAGHSTVELAERAQPDGLVGLSLAGVEHGVRRRDFAGVFDRGFALGLHSVPHAGETAGVGEIWDAVRHLRAERVGHAVSAVRDRRLLDHLATHQITVEVCPTSNLRTGAIASLDDHPVRRLLRAGVPVAVSTDAPPTFGATLCEEYAHVARIARLDHAGIARLAAGRPTLPLGRLTAARHAVPLGVSTCAQPPKLRRVRGAPARAGGGRGRSSRGPAPCGGTP
ncbi:MAG: adenosine deaminase family protein [Micromonosporaceae bacterium]